MRRSFLNKKVFTPFFIVLNILIFFIIILSFRVNLVRNEEDIHSALNEKLVWNINEFYKKKTEIIKSISSINQIVEISAGTLIPNNALLTTT